MLKIILGGSAAYDSEGISLVVWDTGVVNEEILWHILPVSIL